MRHARVCPKCRWRSFDGASLTCPEHGIAVDQMNMPYQGRKLPQPPKPEDDPWKELRRKEPPRKGARGQSK